MALRHLRIDLCEALSENPIELKLPDSLSHRVGSYMNISIHRCLDTGVAQQFLQHLGLHTAFDRPCGVGVPKRVHTKNEYLSALRKRAYHYTLILAQCAPFLKAKSINFSVNREIDQIISCWLMKCSNSFRFTNFFVPTKSTKGQLGERSMLLILLIPILLYSAASLIVSVSFKWIGTLLTVLNRLRLLHDNLWITLNFLAHKRTDSSWQPLSGRLRQCAFADENSEVIHNIDSAPIVSCGLWHLCGVALRQLMKRKKPKKNRQIIEYVVLYKKWRISILYLVKMTEGYMRSTFNTIQKGVASWKTDRKGKGVPMCIYEILALCQ